jgi:KDO2-lipid IV(A) lauroyltransferase
VKSRGVLSFEFGLYRLANGLSRLLPFRFLQALGKTVGALFFLLSSRRRIVLGNLKKVFPEWTAFKRVKTALRCGAHFGRIAFDYLKWSRAPEEILRRKVRLEGLEHLKEALKKDRGAFVLSAHFGHWEVAALRLSLEGFPQAMVHRPLDNPRLEEELSRRRTRFGNTLIPKAGAMKETLRAVKRNSIVDILIDQKADPEGSVTVPFLGVPTPTIASLARLVQSTGASVVPLFSYPDGTGYRISLLPAIPCDPGVTLESLTESYNTELSRAILETPYLWLWFHNRWRI